MPSTTNSVSCQNFSEQLTNKQPIDWTKRAEELQKAFENSDVEHSGCVEKPEQKPD